MEDDALKTKKIVVGDQEIVLYSLDNKTWGSDPKEILRRAAQLQREHERALEYSQKIFPGKYLSKN
jgi:hypothetical protein